MTDVQERAATGVERPGAMSFPARVAGIFAAPSRVFEELKRRPTWLAPLLLATLVSSALNGVVLWSKTGEVAVRQQFEEAMQKTGRTLPPESLDQQLRIYRYVGPASYLIFFPLFTLAFAGVVYLIFSIGLGGEATFKQTLAAYSHVSLIGIVWGLVTVLMIFLKGSLKSSTSIAAFLPFLDEASFAYKFCQGLDLFVIWQFAVLSIGMGILNNLSTKKAATVIFSTYLAIWLIITVIRQAMS